MKEEKVFEVSIVSKTEDIIASTAVVQGIKRAVKIWREPVVALTADAARSKVERKLTKKLTEADAETLIDSLEVKVVLVDFPG